MTDIPQEPVMWRLIDIVQRDRQLHGAGAAAK